MLTLLLGVVTATAPLDLMGPRMPYAAFDQLPATSLQLGGGTVRVALAPGTFGQKREALLAWSRSSSEAVSRWLGGLPVKDVRVLLVPVDGDDIEGMTWGYQGAATRVTVGVDATAEQVAGSWVLAHELVHMAVPRLPDDQLWLTEGLATWVEPMARAQRGLVTPELAWKWILRGVPKGLPAEGDEGLNHTHTWGRTYWGGALFCLLAEVTLRERTGNRKGLQDAMRGLRAAGASNEQAWPIERVLAVADRATGTTVLQDLYAQLKATPVTPDLGALWKRLGVRLEGEVVRFDDSAPLAAARLAMTRAP
jgi:hypothetical protein